MRFGSSRYFLTLVPGQDQDGGEQPSSALCGSSLGPESGNGSVNVGICRRGWGVTGAKPEAMEGYAQKPAAQERPSTRTSLPSL